MNKAKSGDERQEFVVKRRRVFNINRNLVKVVILIFAIDSSFIYFFLGCLFTLAVSLIFYLMSKKGPIPLYYIVTSNIIRPQQQEDIIITYKGLVIDGLYKTIFTFWNHGKRTLLGDKIVANDRIRLDYGDSTILSTRVLKLSRESNNFNLSEGINNTLFINFDYLEPKEGATVEILHTGSPANPKIEGSIVGLRQGVISYKAYSDQPFRKIILKIISSAPIIIGLCSILLFSKYMPVFMAYTKTFENTIVGMVLGLLFLLVSLFTPLIIILAFYQYSYNKMPYPKDLDI